ncbi:hypothetical protein ACH4T9_13055 [Micromonospora sp. NPDC020750]|uniref:hypothetical protein n=1 Tax=unclassified Micromonospora TaxID=2617518 RepID=UPI0037AC749B
MPALPSAPPRPVPTFEAAKAAAKAAADTHRRKSDGHELWEGSVSWLCDDCDAMYPATVRNTN